MYKAPQIFLSHAADDASRVESLYHDLEAVGFKPWMFEKELMPGEKWLSKILDAIVKSDFFLAVLSRNTDEKENFQKEIAIALDWCKEEKSRKNFIIPVLLEECKMPEGLHAFHGVNLFEPDGTDTLIETIRKPFIPSGDLIEPPRPLVQDCDSGKCVLFVGSGLSAPVFPTWEPFVKKFLEWARKKRIVNSDGYKKLFKVVGREGKFDLVVDAIVEQTRFLHRYEDQSDGNELIDYLKSIFIEPISEPTNLHIFLKRVGFSAILTTNFDTLLERTFAIPKDSVVTPEDAELLLEFLARNAFFILKLHGTLDNPNTVRVSQAKYNDAIRDNRAFSEFTENLLISRTVLFLGCSLAGIQNYMESIRFRGSLRRHYALVAVHGDSWEARADQFKRRYGIKVLPYPLTKEHPQVLDFVATLARRIGSESKQVEIGAGVSKRRKKSELKEIRLKNIGPFDDLEIELRPNWNLLLGDNGVGKSNILKAIALATCGRDIQSCAERLLKANRNKGEITLKTSGGETYSTELFRTSSGVEVKTRPARPLEAEGWLAIGFPPIRFLTWRESKGARIDTNKKRPTHDDLTPLITDAPDHRLDELKQWIINLDYRIAKANHERRDFFIKLRDTFFSVIATLTGKLEVKYKEIDPESWRIIVLTDDGEIPIEALSQGTASLIGWIGVTIQRLFDVYERVDNPLDEQAIVLIDEIDAHMHPRWQQEIVPALSKIFPNIQFIATTHSPLVASGIAIEQVFRLARNVDGAVDLLDIPSDMTMGRADQVLTGRLFGLDTTLDKETRRLSARYHDLLGKQERSGEEETELAELNRTLAFRIPVAQETPVERRAQELLRLLMKQQIGDHYPEVQDLMLEKARQLFDEIGFEERKKR